MSAGRDIIEGSSLYMPDGFRVRHREPPLTGIRGPGAVIDMIGRHKFAGLTSDQLANVAPWWIRLVVPS